MIEVFPIDASGKPHFTNDWGFPRTGGRTHQGNDLFAIEGTPAVAVTSGQVKFGQDPLGGQIARLYEPDGTYYYYAHLKGFEGVARPVTVGETIGYVGKTGNAIGTSPHVHFEWHPQGGAAVNPYDALRAAPMRPAGATPNPTVPQTPPNTPIAMTKSPSNSAAMLFGGLLIAGSAAYAVRMRLVR